MFSTVTLETICIDDISDKVDRLGLVNRQDLYNLSQDTLLTQESRLHNDMASVQLHVEQSVDAAEIYPNGTITSAIVQQLTRPTMVSRSVIGYRLIFNQNVYVQES